MKIEYKRTLYYSSFSDYRRNALAFYLNEEDRNNSYSSGHGHVDDWKLTFDFVNAVLFTHRKVSLAELLYREGSLDEGLKQLIVFYCNSMGINRLVFFAIPEEREDL